MANYSHSPTYGGSFNQAVPTPVFQPPINPQQSPQTSATATSFQRNANVPPEQLQAMAAHNPQFAAIWSHLQASGYPPLPFLPPPPLVNGYAVPPPVPPPPVTSTALTPHSVHNQSESAPSSVQSMTSHLHAMQNCITEMVDAEKEEGEVSEGEHGGYRITQAPIPTSILSQSFASLVGQKDDNPGGSPASKVLQASSPTRTQIARQGEPMSSISRLILAGNESQANKHESESTVTREKAKAFIAFLNQHKIGFTALANEGLNTDMLKDLYRDLGIPVPPTHLATTGNINPPKSCASVPPEKPALLADTSAKEVAQPETIDSKPKETMTSSAGTASRGTTTKTASQPVDRQEYIARLMAARSAKQGASSKPAEPPQQPAGAIASSKSIPTGPKAAAVLQSKQPKTDAPVQALKKADQSIKVIDPEVQRQEDAARLAAEKKRLQTELARKRIEMLAAARAHKSAQNAAKAQQEAKQAETQAPAIQPSRSPKSDTSFYDDESGVEGRSSGNRNRPASVSSGTTSSDPFASPGAGASKAKSDRADQTERDLDKLGSIPGLLLSSNQISDPPFATQTQSQYNFVVPANGALNGRKRPVAADFDMEVPQHVQQPKRPFGQPRLDHDQERVVIEVSDDESDASAMDIDDDEDEGQHEMARLPPKVEAARQNNFKDMPPLTNFPPRPGLSRVSSLPRSALDTPPAINTPSSSTGTQMLGAKEKEILELKRKIAEMEQKAAAKRRINTPGASKTTTPPIIISGVPTPDALARQDPLSSAQVPIIVTQPPIETAFPSSLIDGSGPAGSESPMEWRRRRRAEIQSGLPVLEAALESSRAKLEELRKEIAILEADNQRHLEDKEKLIRELESLGIDTDGIPDEELQAKLDEKLNRLELQAIAEQEQEAASEAQLPEPVEISDTTVQHATLSIEEPLPVLVADTLEQPEVIVSVERVVQTEHEETSQSSEVCEDEMDFSPYGTDTGDAEDSNEVEVAQTSNTLDAPLLDATSGIISPFSGESTPQVDHEDFYSPAPIERGEQQGKSTDTDRRSPEQQEDAAEYPDVSSEDDDGASDGLSAMFEQSEDYTPPDTTKVAAEKSDDSSESEEGEIADEANYEPYGTVLDISAADESAVQRESLQSTSQSQDDHQTDASAANSHSPAVADDLAPELQIESVAPAEHREEQAAEPVELRKAAHPAPAAFYKPYESPLRMFKAYRYHPNYTENVSGGFRSLTFSNQISSDDPICRYEAAGGVCNDDQCPDQHFKKMGLSDDMILVQLGTSNPGQTEEEKQEWNAGLRNVLKDLREKNTKDPDVVATAIAEYRRKFLRDPTRVLNI